MMKYKIDFSLISHIGNVRKMNQDNFICNGVYAQPESPDMICQNGELLIKKASVFGIFDGMGGEEHGEIASYIAAKEAANTNFNKDGAFMLKNYCNVANAAICNYAKENVIIAMGTTAAILLFCKKEIVLCNIGDSKIFRFSDGAFEQISEDHISVSSFGRKPPLSQNLGIPPTEMLITPFISTGTYKSKDRYLICSDGLTDMVCLQVIAEIIKENSLQSATELLLKEALKNGGKDNITIILLEIKQLKKQIFKIFNREMEDGKNVL